jgi:hypothetical protein
MDWQASGAFKKKKKVSLKKEKARNYRVTLNALIVINKGIMLGIVTRNRSKTEKLGRKSKS